MSETTGSTDGPGATGAATVTAFFASAAVWMILGAAAGFIGATELVAPDAFGSVGVLTFGRIRALHTNVIILGFAVSILFGAGHFIIPAMVRAPLYSEKLGALSAALWNLTLAAGGTGLVLGHTQAREYAELFWLADVGVVLVFLMMIVNLFLTIRSRRENLLYVSVWYIFGGLILSAATYVIGNVMWVPGKGALHGMTDAIVAWFYGHNVVGLLLTPLSIGVAYYVIPKACRRPLYSHTLSLIGFWMIIVMYTHIGTHHLIQAPAPTWLKVISIVDSIGMIIPVATVLVNLWMTVRGRIGLVTRDIGARFVFTGTVMYLIVCIQGPMHSLPFVQVLTHFNNWVVAHAHLAILGFVSFTAVGGLYFILPRITGKPLYSKRLAVLQYWLMLLGTYGMFVVLTVAGLVQGHAWLNGEVVYRTLPQIHIYMILRQAMGIVIFAAAVVGLINVVLSLAGKGEEPDAGAPEADEGKEATA
ncbi:MAG: cbb3-type cytochrome c oxidase subunit I [Planctomycetota bacterium]